MSTTEIRCLETSTHLLGTILHLDDVIGAFAGRQVAALSDSTATFVLAVATRVAVTAALIFLEFGLLFYYSPLITGALLVGMYLYPVPNEPVAAAIIPHPAPALPAAPEPVTPPPSPPATVERTAVPVTALVTTPEPPPVTVPTTPGGPGSSIMSRSRMRPPELPNRPKSASADLSASMIAPSSARESAPPNMSASVYVSPSPHSTPPRGARDLYFEEEDDFEFSSTPLSSRFAAATQSNQGSPATADAATDDKMKTYIGTEAKLKLLNIISQSLGNVIGSFFVHNMLPPDIESLEYNDSTKEFSIRLSMPQKANIPKVGPEGIEKILGATLNVQRIIRGRLLANEVIFQNEAMTISKTVAIIMTVSYALTSLRKNFDHTLTLSGKPLSIATNPLTITAEPIEFIDTFGNISWN